jgi:hypothetical protein
MSTVSSPAPLNLIDPRYESLPLLPTGKDFSDRLDGVIVLVSVGDVYLAKACCASVRHSMGNIPITLLVDGPNTDTSEIERLPNVERLVAQDIVEKEYSRLCTGFWIKLLIHWKSPYERFLYLDADTLVWGDVRAYADFEKFDFIAAYRFTHKLNLETAEEVQRNVFDLEAIRKLDSVQDWHGQESVNAGAFFVRRGIFGKEKLMALRRLNCWRNYENGMLQYLVWKALREGSPRIGSCRTQLWPADSTSPLEDRFLPRNGQRPAIIHWITKKPRLGRPYRTADDYRKLFLNMTGKTKWLKTRLLLEDIAVWLGRHKRSLLGQKNRSNPIVMNYA